MFKNTQQIKKPLSRRRLMPFGFLILLAAIASISITVSIARTSTNQAASVKQTPADKGSMFSFDAAKASVWHQGPTNQTSTAAFYNNGDCFISMEQKSGTMNDAEQEAQAVATMKSQGNNNVNVINVPLSLNSNTAAIPYTLHEYRSTGGQSNYYQFQEAAYIPNSRGYAYASGYCKNGSDLDATVDALRAITIKL